MRILLIGGTSGVRGGVEQFCERSASALVRYGSHEVAHIRTDGPYLCTRTLHLYFFSFLTVLWHRRRKWDCVWLQYVSFPELAILCWCRVLGFKVIVTPHLGANWRSNKNLMLRSITRNLLRNSNFVALLSESQAVELPLPQDVPIRQIRTFLPDILAADQSTRMTVRNGPLRLIHVARLSIAKGTFDFLEVCRLLRVSGTAFEAELIGQVSPTDLDTITSFITNNDLAEIVRYLGVLCESEVLGALRRSEVLIHLSTVDSYPLIVLEAIGSGVYPICKDLPGARLICKSYCGTIVGLTTSPADIVSILSDDRDYRLQMARVAAEAVRKDHDWQLCANLALSVFRDATLINPLETELDVAARSVAREQGQVRSPTYIRSQAQSDLKSSDVAKPFL